MDTNGTARSPRPGRIRTLVSRLEARIDRQREMLWQPRMELILAREIAQGQRHLEALRRRRS